MSVPVRVAMIGLGFGAEFIPIYQAHPDAEVVALCRRNEAELTKSADLFGIDTRCRDLHLPGTEVSQRLESCPDMIV